MTVVTNSDDAAGASDRPPTDGPATTDENAGKSAIVVSGRQAVVGIYLVAVVIAAGFGAVLALTVDPGAVATLGPVEFAITPVTLALYGALSVAIGLGAFLGLVAAVASRSR